MGKPVRVRVVVEIFDSEGNKIAGAKAENVDGLIDEPLRGKQHMTRTLWVAELAKAAMEFIEPTGRRKKLLSRIRP